VVSFRNRINCLDEVSHPFLRLLVALGGYCTALQGQELIAISGSQARARLKGVERLGFLRRITKYPGGLSGHEIHDSPAEAGFE
jgi:hypothetical protein